MHNILRHKKQHLKGIVAAVVLSVLSFSSFAQLRDRINLPDTDEKAYHIGIVVMGATSRFQISHHPRFLQYDSVLAVYPENNIGIGIGGMHTLKISNHFEARVVFPQLLFANKSITYELKEPDPNNGGKLVKKNIESILLGIPIQLKFKSDRINNFRVYMMGGIKFETDLASKARAKNAEDMIKLKSMDFGVEAGIGFNFYMRYFILSPEIKISNGLSNSHSRDESLKYSNVVDKLQSRMVVFSLIFEG
ncbi:MAG: outer membrane beta-barrel protein [Gemmatimonadaceae bacterium]|nr:outer membrane beta-barrel protein [Chitinophagaceae bacterium]